MAGVLKKSVASWGEAHGFVVLCLIAPEGERFVVVQPDQAMEAIDVAREWATTVTTEPGSPPVLWKLPS
jgi:hypothetical protein